MSPIGAQVIALARRDGLSTLRFRDGVLGLLPRLFALRRDNPLADARLESLRRFAVRAWHEPARIEPRHLAEISAAGFRPNDIFATVQRLRTGGAPIFA